MNITRWLAEKLDPGLRYERMANEIVIAQPSAMKQLPSMGQVKAGRPAVEVKSITGGDMVPLGWSNKPLWSDWDTLKAMEEGFGGSLWVYIAIDKIARSLASLPWLAEQRIPGETEEWEPAVDSPLHALISQPNEKQSNSEFIYRLVVSLFVSGNAVISKIRGLGGIPGELWVVGPAGITVIPHEVDFIAGYKYEINGKKERIDAEDAIHIQFPDPANAFWGMPPMKAGSKAIDTEAEASNWQKLSLQNRCIPDGIIGFKGSINKKQYEDARERIKEQYSGASNARQLMILGNDAAYTQLGLSAQEMDFIDSRKMSREEILALHGTPPPVVGLYEQATLNNVKTAREIFWLDTCLPLASAIADAFNTALAPEFGDQYRVMYDSTNVEALWEVFERKLEAAEKLMKMGVPFAEVNHRLQLGFEDRPHHHLSYVGTDLVPIGGLLVDTAEDEL